MAAEWHVRVGEGVAESLTRLRSEVRASSRSDDGFTGGQARAAVEYRRPLQAAGFDLSRIVGTASPTSVIEATVC
jgi:hypothetical protein